MKKIIRYTILFSFSIVTASILLGNFKFDNLLQTIILTGFILTLFELVLKPIIKILLLPITILTLGLIRIVINTLGLYLAVFLVPGLTITNIHIPSNHLQGIIIPEISLTGFFAYLVTSAIVSLIFNFFTKTLIIKIST